MMPPQSPGFLVCFRDSLNNKMSCRPTRIRFGTPLSAGGKWISNHRYPHARDALMPCRGLSAETRVRCRRQYDQSEGKLAVPDDFRSFALAPAARIREREQKFEACFLQGRSHERTPLASRSTDADHPLGRGSVPQPGRSVQFKQKTPPHRAKAPMRGASRSNT